MSLTLQQVKALVDGEGYRYFEDPRRPALLLGFEGQFGHYQMLILLADEGRFLQFRSMNYLYCPAAHPSLGEVLKALGDVNYRNRLIKLGWDPGDGELVAYADLWVQDGAVTEGQFKIMMITYLIALDHAYGRLRRALDTGKDPGDIPPEPAPAPGGPGKEEDLSRV